MDVYHFSEMAYHPAWEEGRRHGSFRVGFPNGVIDPKIASNLLNRYLDEFMLADELGLNIMLNEHHSTATCMTASCTVPLSILARQTRKARLLALGNPIAHRPDPVRVATLLQLLREHYPDAKCALNFETPSPDDARALATRQAYRPGDADFADFNVVQRTEMIPGQPIAAPCIIEETESTTVFPYTGHADMDGEGNIHLYLREGDA